MDSQDRHHDDDVNQHNFLFILYVKLRRLAQKSRQIWRNYVDLGI